MTTDTNAMRNRNGKERRYCFSNHRILLIIVDLRDAKRIRREFWQYVLLHSLQIAALTLAGTQNITYSLNTSGKAHIRSLLGGVSFPWEWNVP